MLVKITNLDEKLINLLKEITKQKTAAKAVLKAAEDLPSLIESIDFYKEKNQELQKSLYEKEEKIKKIKSAIEILKLL